MGVGGSYPTSSKLPLLHLQSHPPPTPMVPSPLYPGFASAQTVFAGGSRCRPPSGAAGDAPFPDRSPLPAKRTPDDGCGPGGVGKRVRLPPRSSGLERCSGSQRGPRLPNFPGFIATINAHWSPGYTHLFLWTRFCGLRAYFLPLSR